MMETSDKGNLDWRTEQQPTKSGRSLLGFFLVLDGSLKSLINVSDTDSWLHGSSR